MSLVATARAQPHSAATPRRAKLAALLACGAVLGCSEPEPRGVAVTATAVASTTAPQPTGSRSPAAPSPILEGAVLDVVHAGHYSYLHLETPGGRFWTAVQQADVAAGSRVVIERAMHIRRFHSPALERDFDSIFFGVLRGAPPPTPRPLPQPPLPIPRDISVPKAAGPAGLTVAEVLERAHELRGKTVQLRAIVVRVSANILDRNWIHVQDGSGSEEEGSHDLLVTARDLPRVGQVVLITGTVATELRLDEDLSLPILVEKATIVAGV